MTASGPVLRDIHLPAEPSWWPPAPGWWVIAALVLLSIAYLGWRAWRVHRLARARRRLHVEFERVCAEHPASSAAAECVAALSMLLRRATRRYDPQALALRDEAWLEFLDAGDTARPFSQGPGRLLLDGPYRPRIDANEAQALAGAVRARLDGFVRRA